MDEYTMQEFIKRALYNTETLSAYEEDMPIQEIRSFECANLLARNKGLVITLEDGREFYVTIVQTKLSR